jgi:hypothetical protein
MSHHTITITRLPDDENDDTAYVIGGEHDSTCQVWRECDGEHPDAECTPEERSGDMILHGIRHRLIDHMWCHWTDECAVDHCTELGLEADEKGELGTFVLDIEWDDDFYGVIGGPVPQPTDPQEKQ